ILGAQHRLGLHELDVAVGDHVEAVAPGICDVVAAEVGAKLAGGRDHAGDVVDDQTEVSMLPPRLDGLLEEGDELVTEVDESHVSRAAAQPQLRKERTPELECLLEAADVKRDMIDPQRTSHQGKPTSPRRRYSVEAGRQPGRRTL